MVIKDPCGICKKPVATNHNALMCDVCDQWVHIKCNFVSKNVYNMFIDENTNPSINEKDKSHWVCINCVNSNLAFGHLDEKSFHLNSRGITNNFNLENINFSLNPSDKQLTDQISKMIVENTDPDNDHNFCSYYEIEDFLQAKFDSNSNFSILHLNIASLQFHFEELKILLQMLDYEFDCIMITETKLKKNINPSICINIPNYHYFHTPTEASKGGSLIYISNKLISKPRKDLEIYQSRDVESTFSEIIVPNGKNIIVGCVYKHHTIDANEFEKLLLPTLRKANKEKKPVIIAGDFNIDLLKLNKDKFTNGYFDQLTNINFMPLITLPTRITTKSKTLIDNILFNEFSHDIKSGNINVSISDHSPQFAIIPIKNKKSKTKSKQVFVRNFRNSDQNTIKNTFQSIDWNSNGNLDSDSTGFSANQDLSQFLDKSNKAIDDLFPYKKLSNKELNLKHNPWITNETIKEIKIRDKLYSKHKKATDLFRKEDLALQLRNQKNKVKHLLRTSKKHYFSKYFEENSRNAKKLWEGVNQILASKKSKPYSSINCLEIKDKDNLKSIITNPKDISNTANDYFTNIAGDILKKRKFNGNKHFKQYLKNSNLNQFVINPTDPKEIEQIIKDFDPTKSVGPNSLPPKIIKQISSLISKPLADIFNKSFISGVFPDLFKISKINPTHKKDSKLIISNYRPISLLSNLNKIIEKLMFKRLYSFLEQHKCIYDLQFGFRENHSTNHALISIVQKIQEAIKNKKLAIGIFIDLQKAFDTVNHFILLEKLKHYGISGVSNAWFKSYLTDRKQYVSIGGVDSDYTTTEHGVPQGSVLGPLLFLIYINDLHQCIKNSSTFHFADDTNLLYVPPKRIRNKNIVRRLNIDLKALNNWLTSNKISLNSSKTELIVFREKNTPIPKLNLKLNGTKLEPKSEIKYLGLIIDEHLTFKGHINIMNSKLKRANNLLALSRHYLPSSLLKQVYYAQFHSHLSYGCQVWGLRPASINQTIILQKKAIRLMSFSHKYAPTNPIFKDLQVLQLEDLITSNNINFVHKTLTNASPSHFNNFYKLYTPSHNHDTVNNPSSLYSIPAGSVCLADIEAGTFKYRCAQDWNKIIKAIYRTTNNTHKLLDVSINSLKSITKAHFIGAY